MKLSRRNPNQKQVMAVEIQPSADDGAAWYSPVEGGRNVQHRDHAYQPVVDVTVHLTDGTRQSRREYVGEPRINRKAEAQAAAEKRGRELAERARSKGVAVVGQTGRSTRKRYPPSAASTEDEIANRIVPLLLPAFLVACVVSGGLLYYILP
jgi:hypothetical protein